MKFLLSAIIIFQTSLVFSLETETIGRTYTIAEKNQLLEFKKEAANFDMQKYRKAMIKKLKDLENIHKFNLPKATENKTFEITLQHTQERNMVDENGNVIYSKGLTFNPAAYVHHHGSIIILNPNDPYQVNWFKQSKYYKDLTHMLLITKGKFFKQKETIKHSRMFYLVPEITTAFNIQAVPSVVHQEGSKIIVQEILVEDK